jgi:hypothetical protein
MTAGSDANRWIGFEEAFTALEAKMGLPSGLLPRPRDPMTCQEGAMMWFSDHAILVHEVPLGFGFDRGEFEAILQKVKRVDLGVA